MVNDDNLTNYVTASEDNDLKFWKCSQDSVALLLSVSGAFEHFVQLIAAEK